MNLQSFARKASNYATAGVPFLFVIDFELQKPLVCRLEDAEDNDIYYDIKGISNIRTTSLHPKVELKCTPIDKHFFSEKFQRVIRHLKNGDSYLLNLTFPTPIEINLTLAEIFREAQAPYKLLYKDRFVVFSPECFIRTGNNEIFTCPMKGTIDATIDGAENILLNNRKEEWEHNTIIDLMRNDISMIATDVTLTRYRYIERIKTNRNQILQTSSEIKGNLPRNWRMDLGNSLLKLLPAGSVSGAPKKKTVEIIRQTETDKRGFYTGIFGIFDGENLDSAVSIRYIEKKNNKMFYRSGGGVTANSNMDDEYREIIQKIYVPVV
jgi:para-aminobenzoate synthetase component 1